MVYTESKCKINEPYLALRWHRQPHWAVHGSIPFCTRTAALPASRLNDASVTDNPESYDALALFGFRFLRTLLHPRILLSLVSVPQPGFGVGRWHMKSGG